MRGNIDHTDATASYPFNMTRRFAEEIVEAAQFLWGLLGIAGGLAEASGSALLVQPLSSRPRTTAAPISALLAGMLVSLSLNCSDVLGAAQVRTSRPSPRATIHPSSTKLVMAGFPVMGLRARPTDCGLRR